MNWRHPVTWAAIALNVVLLLLGWRLLAGELADNRAAADSIERSNVISAERKPELEAELAELQDRRAALEARLTVWRERFAPMQNDRVFAMRKVEGDDARIDFKVALFDTRERLNQRADGLGLYVPESLGLSDTIAEDEDTETRVWQLVTVAQLIESALDQEFPSIDYIKPLPPPEPTAAGDWVYREYPVEMSVLCTFGDWIASLRGVAETRPHLALRHMRVEVNHPWPATMLSVETVYSGSRIEPAERLESPTPKASVASEEGP